MNAVRRARANVLAAIDHAADRLTAKEYLAFLEMLAEDIRIKNERTQEFIAESEAVRTAGGNGRSTVHAAAPGV